MRAEGWTSAGKRNPDHVSVSVFVFVGGTRTAPRATHSPHKHATALAHGSREPRAGLLLERSDADE